MGLKNLPQDRRPADRRRAGPPTPRPRWCRRARRPPSGSLRSTLGEVAADDGRGGHPPAGGRGDRRRRAPCWDSRRDRWVTDCHERATADDVVGDRARLPGRPGTGRVLPAPARLERDPGRAGLGQARRPGRRSGAVVPDRARVRAPGLAGRPGRPADERAPGHRGRRPRRWPARTREQAGATLADFQPQEDVRVYLDPAGHPFCLFL